VKPDFEVGIIGGGPGGAAAAAYLAKAGISCVVFEREVFPRPHVGESLVPASTRVFRDLGLIERLEGAGFVRKYGAAWTSAARPVYSHDFGDLPEDYQASIRFHERQQPGVDRPYTYHVDRGAFDLLLLRHAQSLGAEVREDAAVGRVDLDDPALPVIHARRRAQSFATRVRVVLDASGRRTLLGSQLRLKVTDPMFDQYALHSWFSDVERPCDDRSGHLFVHFVPLTNTWIWQIPISDEITSIGLVTQKKSFAKARLSRQQFFWQTATTRPELLDKLRRARQVRPWTEEADYSYAMSRICGDGWALIGDAARFVDPIFASGVSIALNSARLVTTDIRRALERSGEVRHRDFEEFETLTRRGMNNWYRFVSLYYRLNILFTYFISEPEYRLQVLQLLQGDVYDEDEPPVLEEMRRLAKRVEDDHRHPWHALLGDLSAEAFRAAF